MRSLQISYKTFYFIVRQSLFALPCTNLLRKFSYLLTDYTQDWPNKNYHRSELRTTNNRNTASSEVPVPTILLLLWSQSKALAWEELWIFSQLVSINISLILIFAVALILTPWYKIFIFNLAWQTRIYKMSPDRRRNGMKLNRFISLQGSISSSSSGRFWLEKYSIKVV